MRKIVYVKWVDALGLDGWRKDPKFDEAEIEHESIGFEIENNKRFISFAQSRQINGSGFSELMIIPKKMILSKKYLNETAN